MHELLDAISDKIGKVPGLNGKIHYGKAPESSPLPFIVFNMVDENITERLTDGSHISKINVDVAIYSIDRKFCADIAREIEDEFDTHPTCLHMVVCDSYIESEVLSLDEKRDKETNSIVYCDRIRFTIHVSRR